jgi:hypothetical protein
VCFLVAQPDHTLQYVVKLADKNDYLLASKVLSSGVEFGILKQVRLPEWERERASIGWR